MPTYITLFNLTEKGIKDIKNAPGRIEEALKGFEKIGGKLIGFYAVMGEYDYISVGEAPNDEVASAFMLTIGAQGNIRSKTFKAFTTEEFARIVGNIP